MFEEIQAIIRIVLNEPDLVLTPGTKASDVPLWDSLKNIDIISSVEDAFPGLRFSAEDMDKLHTGNVGMFVRMAEKNMERFRTRGY